MPHPIRRGSDLVIERCGCSAELKRVCDLCDGAPGVFVACSLACLERHQRRAHADFSEDPRARAIAYLTKVNRQIEGSWESYRGHRDRLMDLVEATPRGGDIGIFGAGNGSDVDLVRLLRSFDEVHLVDLDGEALERARGQVEARERERVVAHPGIDLSGFLGRLDVWGERLPEPHELGPLAVVSAQEIVQAVGRPFDVVLSTSVLSQLMAPFQRAWVMSTSHWARLKAAITAVHLATLAGSTRPGGSGVMAFDVLSSKDVPGLVDQADKSDELLSAFVETSVANGAELEHDPAALLQMLRSPALAALFETPRLTSPWLWNLGAAVQLVYGLEFKRPIIP